MADPIIRLNEALDGRYRLEREIGEGGMATVYLAEDLRHRRLVALKVLRPELAAIVGTDRFLAEITTTANLQHPHILPLFDSGEADGFLFYVMPLIEGESLRARLDREGQLPIEEALALATAAASGLDYAHRHGVIHRDVKPENILLHDGQPLVADFGIALAVSTAGGKRLTETGMSLGTPYYMSPEQATADRTPDARSDVYSLGCVVYEMLVGDPPFVGSTAQAVLGKIIQGEIVSASAHRPSVPAHVEGAIRKALERLPSDRFQSADEFAGALNDVGFRYGPDREPGASSVAQGWKRATLVTATLWLLATAVAAWLWAASSESGATSSLMYLPLAEDPPRARNQWGSSVYLSPDGQTLGYLGAGREYWVRRLSASSGTPLRQLGWGQHLTFSPDGTAVAMRRGLWVGHIAVANLGGGEPIILTDSAGAQSGIDWGHDGWIYFTRTDLGLARVPAAGGPVEVLTKVDQDSQEAAHMGPQLLPSGTGVLFVIRRRARGDLEGSELAVLDLETGAHRGLGVRGVTARYSASGHLVFARSDGVLMAGTFDQRAMRLTSSPVEVMAGVSVTGGMQGLAEFDMSDDGKLLFVSASPYPTGRAYWIGRDGSVTTAAEGRAGVWRFPAVSPSGERLATTVYEERSPANIYAVRAPDGPTTKLTFGDVLDYDAAFLDEGTVVFSSPRDGNWDLYLTRWDGRQEARKILDRPGEIRYMSASRDGTRIAFCELTDVDDSDVLLYRLDVDSVSSIAETPFAECQPDISPDGQWVVYQSEEGGQPQIWLAPALGSGLRRQISHDGGRAARWSRDGTEIYYLDSKQDLIVVSVGVDSVPVPGVPRRLFSAAQYDPRYAVGPDGRFLMVPPLGPTAGRLTLITNFFDELRRLAPG